MKMFAIKEGSIKSRRGVAFTPLFELIKTGSWMKDKSMNEKLQAWDLSEMASRINS